MMPFEMAQACIAAGDAYAQECATVGQPSLLARRVSIRDMIVRKPEPIDMVLDGLPLGSLGVVLGQGGVGKSIATMMVSYAVAIGSDPLGCLLAAIRVTPYGRVVRLCGEDDRQIMHHRMHAFGRTLPEQVVDAMDERMYDVPLVGCAPTLMDAAGNLDEVALVQIREAAKGTRLLIIDPLRQFHAGDENNNGMMTLLIKALTLIAHEQRCAIILVHHVNKASAKDGQADAAMSRGAAAITDNARWVLALSKLSDQAVEEFGLTLPSWRYVSVRRVKSNYAALGDATILVRGDGGILSPTQTVRRDHLADAMQSIGGDIDSVSVPAHANLPRTAADLLEMGDDDVA